MVCADLDGGELFREVGRLGARLFRVGTGFIKPSVIGQTGSGSVRNETSSNLKFKFKFKKLKNSQKIPKNTSRCDKSNGVKISQKFVHLV